MPTLDEMLQYFAEYNLRVWPMQIIGYVLCVVVVFAAVKRFKYTDRIIAAVVAFFWFWTGLMFWLPSGSLFPSGFGYALVTLSIVQGFLFLLTMVKPVASYRFGTDPFSLTGLGMIVFATIIYPAIGYAVGHTFPHSLTVGVFPCPTTIFTLGLLLCAAGKLPRFLVVIPVLAAIVIGSSALYGVLTSGSIVEDIGLLISGIVAGVMFIFRDRAMLTTRALRPTV